MLYIENIFQIYCFPEYILIFFWIIVLYLHNAVLYVQLLAPTIPFIVTGYEVEADKQNLDIQNLILLCSFKVNRNLILIYK